METIENNLRFSSSCQGFEVARSHFSARIIYTVVSNIDVPNMIKMGLTDVNDATHQMISLHVTPH